ncbi:MAG: acetylglutamate kinase, partial [Saprospiraceae bacterium]|nr:acetylglutamate kinase [Saprospiraceae bacterium]
MTRRILVKYGGNAMRSETMQEQVIHAMVELKNRGLQVIIVHGGGPFIAEQLDSAGIRSEFIDGHRKTTTEAMPHIEMALKGRVNGQLVSLFNKYGSLALGISGKDAQTVVAKRRKHILIDKNGKDREVDIGWVGDVASVNVNFLDNMLEEEITPVIACLGTDLEGNDYNINADMMAGHIAGVLTVDHFVVLTDIDGLRRDVNDENTKIDRINIRELRGLF